ncbi:hypothetical protein [Dyella sp. Tek66A03]|uniref:hypothetical protein n=1 Tax=Dyella sp. Tek66A03 TaxID=3458298 RepID=UPI00403E6B50
MDDMTLSIAAASFELGVPAGALALYLYRPKHRRAVIVVLGATCLPLALYLLIVAGHFLSSAGKSQDFAFYAMWVMTFWAYLAVLVGAIAVAFVSRPTNLVARFFVGLASAPASYLLFNALF